MASMAFSQARSKLLQLRDPLGDGVGLGESMESFPTLSQTGPCGLGETAMQPPPLPHQQEERVPDPVFCTLPEREAGGRREAFSLPMPPAGDGRRGGPSADRHWCIPLVPPAPPHTPPPLCPRLFQPPQQ